MTAAKTRHLSVIETLSAGYALLNRRPWVLLVPIVLDLYLLFGARLSFAPIFRLFRDRLATSAAVLTTDPQQQERLVVELLNVDMRNALALLNFVPAVVPRLQSVEHIASTATIYASSPPQIVAAGVLVNLVALLASSIFLGTIAESLATAPAPHASYLQRLVAACLRLSGYGIVLVGAICTFTLPLLMVLAIAYQLAPGLAIFLLFAGFSLWVWLWVYTGFAVEALLLGGRGPLRAILSSIQVVRHYFLGTLGLLALTIIILAGLRVVWNTLALNLPGILLSILGHAYVSSGLVAARFVFYRDRAASVLQDGANLHR